MIAGIAGGSVDGARDEANMLGLLNAALLAEDEALKLPLPESVRVSASGDSRPLGRNSGLMRDELLWWLV